MSYATPFDLTVLETHKMFYVLQHIDFDANEYTITAESPSGRQPVDFVDLFRTADGRLIAAWKHPFQNLPVHQVWVHDGATEENVNLTALERVIDIYDRPTDATAGIFIFADSKMLAGPSGEWRCDTGKYTASQFIDMDAVFGSNNDFKFVEFVLSVNTVGYVLYIESHTHAELGDPYCNAAITPAATRTFQELVKLIDEWSAVARPPFDNTEAIAVKADRFMTAMRWTPTEFDAIQSQPSMQISRFLAGDLDARRRPASPAELSPIMRRALFSRMAASSFSALSLLHDGLGDSKGLLDAETVALQNGLNRFYSHYQIDSHIPLSDTDAIVSAALAAEPYYEAYVRNQLRNFRNKTRILEGVANGDLL